MEVKRVVDKKSGQRGNKSKKKSGGRAKEKEATHERLRDGSQCKGEGGGRNQQKQKLENNTEQTSEGKRTRRQLMSKEESEAMPSKIKKRKKNECAHNGKGKSKKTKIGCFWGSLNAGTKKSASGMTRRG